MDQRIIISGNIFDFNQVRVNNILRLNSDGTLDTNFVENTTPEESFDSRSIGAIAVQSDGKIIVGGFFTTFNGVETRGIIRLNSNGTPDTNFIENVGDGSSSSIKAILIQSDKKIIIGGLFQAFSGTARSRIARIGGDIAQ